MTEIMTRGSFMWKAEYNNDTGYTDESFWEWWEVTNGEKIFKTDEKSHAEWLCSLLNGETQNA